MSPTKVRATASIAPARERAEWKTLRPGETSQHKTAMSSWTIIFHTIPTTSSQLEGREDGERWCGAQNIETSEGEEEERRRVTKCPDRITRASPSMTRTLVSSHCFWGVLRL